MASLDSYIVCLLFLVLLYSSLCSFSFFFFWCTRSRMWIDWLSVRGMVLGLFLGNALVDIYAQCGKCEVVDTSSVCFPEYTNVGQVAEILGWVPLQPPLELLQLYLLELCPMLESIQKCLRPRLCKLDQLTLYELRYHDCTWKDSQGWHNIGCSWHW